MTDPIRRRGAISSVPRSPLAAVVTSIWLSVIAFMPSARGAQQGASDMDVEALTTPRVTAVGDCPGAEAVAQIVETLAPRRAIPAPRRGAEVSVADQGDSYRVQVVVEGTPHARRYRDAARDCAYRARVAAVFVVLTLMPPELLMDSPAAPPVAPPAVLPPLAVAAAPPALVQPPAWRPSLTLAGVLDLAPALRDAARIISPGAELRFALQHGRIAGELGLGVQPSAMFSLAGVDVRQRRVPVDLSLALRRRLRGAFALGAAAGIAGAIFSVEGVNTAMRETGTRVDLGARAAVEVRVASPSDRWAAFIGGHVLCFPRPYELATTPAGVVGRSPFIWIGARLGASLSF